MPPIAISQAFKEAERKRSATPPPRTEGRATKRVQLDPAGERLHETSSSTYALQVHIYRAREEKPFPHGLLSPVDLPVAVPSNELPASRLSLRKGPPRHPSGLAHSHQGDSQASHIIPPPSTPFISSTPTEVSVGPSFNHSQSQDLSSNLRPVLFRNLLPISDAKWIEKNPELHKAVEDVFSQSEFDAFMTVMDVSRTMHWDAELVHLLHALKPVIEGAIKESILESKNVIEESGSKIKERLQAQLAVDDHVRVILREICQNAYKKQDWSAVCNLAIGRRESVGQRSEQMEVDMSHQEEATEQSWQCVFHGDAAENLWNHIVRHYGPQSPSSVSSIYANYASIVQSSGMGKSRTVDELAKTHLLIPINLRPPESIGFPAADKGVRDFLAAPPYRMETQNSPTKAFFPRICAFLEALMSTTARRIEDLEGQLDHYTDEGIAAAFRELMCNGQTMFSHNEYRNIFYQEVIDEAMKILKEGDMNSNSITAKSPGHSRHAKEFEPSVACGRLLHALDRLRSSGKQKEMPAAVGGRGTGLLTLAPKTAGESDPMAKRRAKIVGQEQTPRIVLAFDEAQSLQVSEDEGTMNEWSRLDVVRRALRGMNNMPLFSLFLSTSGDVDQFSPSSTTSIDSGARIKKGVWHMISPYSDLGFDHFARMYDSDESWRLETVVDEEYMSGLGRPLLGSRYKSGGAAVREGLVGFAVDKLINRKMSDLLTPNDPNRKLDKELTDAQKFACLSQRLALEFMSTRHVVKEEQEQVASHLRICLKIDENFKNMKTASASEPMFAEAAYKVMQHFDPVAALLRSLQGLRIHQGDCGELVVLLLLTMARDLAVGPSRLDGRPVNGESGRMFSMTEFIQQLFPRSAEIILDARPSRDDGTTHTLRTHIEASVVHFNHFIQVHQSRMIRRRFIVRSMARGAAILPDPSLDIDCVCVFGFCAFGSSMHIGNVGIFMCQDTLGPRYADEPDWSLHDAMDPTKLEMFEEEDDGVHRGADGSVLAPVPVIRVVFALNADESVVVVRPNTGEDPNPLFRTYDIWCAGISKEKLGPVNSDNFDSWMALRNRADAWRSTYEEPGVPEEQLELRCMLTPGAAAEEAFFANWAKDHMGIV